MARPIALITGVTGQDGGYLASLLTAKGYDVHGLRRRTSSSDAETSDGIGANRKYLPGVTLHFGDMTDAASIMRVLGDVKPDEVYNLAAQSHVHVSFEKPSYTASVNALGCLHVLEGMRLLGLLKTARFYQASTSEMYGDTSIAPQSEATPFHPRSPYAISKLFAHLTTVNYREAYGAHASSGICFNHEGPTRGPHFVTRKITMAVARWAKGERTPLKLGNLSSRRDWGHVRDFVEGMWLMLQQPHGDDYVLATGTQHTVRDAAAAAFRCIGIDVVWQGAGLDEKGINAKSGETLLEVDPAFFRPAEVNQLIGDASKARRVLGWQPRTGFEDLIREMVESDLARLTPRQASAN